MSNPSPQSLVIKSSKTAMEHPFNSGWWLSPTPLKNDGVSSSVGMITFPTEWTVINHKIYVPKHQPLAILDVDVIWFHGTPSAPRRLVLQGNSLVLYKNWSQPWRKTWLPTWFHDQCWNGPIGGSVELLRFFSCRKVEAFISLNKLLTIWLWLI